MHPKEYYVYDMWFCEGKELDIRSEYRWKPEENDEIEDSVCKELSLFYSNKTFPTVFEYLQTISKTEKLN